ncbi:MAG: hypothetical protein JF588_19290 [Caulobacterales bacterium]|nr:hypothetical protein [Caulobacterales bacterium]
MTRLVDLFIAWAVKRAGGEDAGQEVVTFEDRHEFWRYAPFWPDEFVSRSGKHWSRPPWWRPFNVLLHHWDPDKDAAEPMHDHPRWSVTICLRGKIIERTPWGERVLTPGSIVLRSRKAIHSFVVPEGFSGGTWTLFIVGRRNYPQNTYVVTQRGVV